MLRISLLGEFRLENAAGQRLPLTSRKLEWLFAYLVLHPTTHPRDRLAGQFWPDSEQDKANRSLRQALYILRPVIEPEDSARGIYLYASQTTVQFNKESPHWLDVKEFETLVKESEALAGTEKAQRLQAAVSLYHGDLLDGCYEDWCLEARGYFRELYLKALQQLVLHHTEQKAYAQAIGYAKQILAKNPLHEEMHRHLMYLYYASGDRNAALHQYHECESILKTELNIEPLPETKDLFREIEQQTSLVQLEALASRARELIRRYPELSVPFVGRTEESQQFTLAWDKASQGQGQTFFMAGEAGVGKSRLAQEWLNFASTHGGWVLSGRCYEIEGKLSYQPIVEALRSGLSQITAESLGRISPIWMSEVIKLVPELGEKIPSLQPSAPLAMPLQERNRLFEGLYQFFLSLSQEKPLLLFFDDLQWADESTLEFIHYLVRKLPSHKLFLLGTYRVEEVTEEHPLWKQLQHLQRDYLMTQLSLAPLQAEDLGKLLYGMLKSGELGELGQWVYERSKGIPFFAVELIK
ncbi:AAA family ATPase, partial [Candidatus Acetothermia bacterium]|nr:AAA family ATPase [Candidatus Acetothermia bacterium]